MDDLAQREAPAEPRHDLVLHEVLHFEGHARQRDHRAAVAFEPHAGGRAVGVEEHRARRGHEGLRAVQFVVFDAARREHAFDVGGDRLVADHAAAEECGERLLGDVVLRGAQTSGQHDDLRVAERALHGFGDACGVVAHRVLGEHDDARGVEVAGDGDRIGVGDLSDQNLVADGDDRGFHASSLLRTSRVRSPAAPASAIRARHMSRTRRGPS